MLGFRAHVGRSVDWGRLGGVGGANLGADLGFVGWADNGVGGAEEADDRKGAESQMGGGEMGSQRGRSGPASSVALPLGPCSPHLGSQSFPPLPAPS